MSTDEFETICTMPLKHLPNDAKLILQRQKSDIIGDKIQFGIPSTFVNSDNNQTVWNKGPSIQLEQIPELIEMLTKTYEKYSEKKNSLKQILERLTPLQMQLMDSKMSTSYAVQNNTIKSKDVMDFLHDEDLFWEFVAFVMEQLKKKDLSVCINLHA